MDNAFSSRTADPPKNLKPHVTRRGALFWCGLLGFVGAHRFYRQQFGLGWLYLLFSWTLIPLAASVMDFVALLLQDDDEFLEEMGDNVGYCQRVIGLQIELK